jgi:hypothetical protein
MADLMRVYSESSTSAHESELQTMWNLSFAALDKNSRSFLGIAAFLLPELIPQSLFELGNDSDLEGHLEFCTDKARYD